MSSPNPNTRITGLSIQIPNVPNESVTSTDSEPESIGTSRHSFSSDGSVGSPILDGSMFRPDPVPQGWQHEDWILNPGGWRHFQNEVRRFHPGVTIYPVLGYETYWPSKNHDLKTIVFWGENRNLYKRGAPNNDLHMGIAIKMHEEYEVTVWYPMPLQHFKNAFHSRDRSQIYREFGPSPYHDVPGTEEHPPRRIKIWSYDKYLGTPGALHTSDFDEDKEDEDGDDEDEDWDDDKEEEAKEEHRADSEDDGQELMSLVLGKYSTYHCNRAGNWVWEISKDHSLSSLE